MKLSEFTTLQDAIEYEEITYIDMSTSVLNAYIGGYGLSSFVASLTDDKGIMLNATRSINGKFDFDENSAIGSSNVAYIDYLIESNPDLSESLTSFKESAIDYCKSVSYPYCDATLLQWNKANNIYTSITKQKPSYNLLKLTVSGCDEKCQSVAYGISDDYDEPQNLGRAAWGQNKFVFDLSGIAFDEIEIRFPFENVVEI